MLTCRPAELPDMYSVPCSQSATNSRQYRVLHHQAGPHRYVSLSAVTLYKPLADS